MKGDTQPLEIMAITRYTSKDATTPITQVEFYKNSFGREDATIQVRENVEPGALRDLSLKLKLQGITAYADVRDGKQVLTAYGFKDHEKLNNFLKQEKLIGTVDRAEEAQANENKAGSFKQFVQRYAIRLAAASGLMGHVSMGAISYITGNNKYVGTAWKYTTADAIIATYGTDKSVTADPIMQDFKNYLWEQKIDNSFVKARNDSISAGEGFNNFMKKYSFQMANAFGAMGNINQVQIGMEEKNPGFVFAGVTSLMGAGLQIFGSEKKKNPQQMERKGALSKAFGFIDANPMQIAAATNFGDPIALFYSAANSQKIDETNLRNNKVELAENWSKVVEANMGIRDLFKGEQDSKAFTKLNETAGKLATEYSREGRKMPKLNFKEKGFEPKFDQANADKLQADLNKQLNDLAKSKGLKAGKNGEVADFKGNLFKKLNGPQHEDAAKSLLKIKDLQESNKQIRAGQEGGLKRILLFAVAVFYTGATLLRFVAKKTATAEENKDAFNEVYAAAAESLLNIKDPKEREGMLSQMSHYLSTHEKMKEPSTAITDKIRERVEAFEKSPFVQVTDGLDMPSPANDVEVQPQQEAEQQVEPVAKLVEDKAPISEPKVKDEPLVEEEIAARKPEATIEEIPAPAASKEQDKAVDIIEEKLVNAEKKAEPKKWIETEELHENLADKVKADLAKRDEQAIGQPMS